MKVTIVEYRPSWQELFEQEKIMLNDALKESAAVIEHIGSTSVVGLAAKPVIDIMIGVPDFPMADGLVPKIVTLGYEYVPQYEDVMPYRRYFRKKQHKVSTHHIHMVQVGGEFWERHLLFRNYLRENPDAVKEYAALKKALTEREWNNGNQYADAKTEFIRKIEAEARKK